ncbi:condensation domain-containing protein, partial [Rhodococcus erythropolis]|nr:condensation domain-containing protein [Rhodococcus erythropolis]
MTASTVVQAAWGVLLAITTGSTDVVFGSVVSGRPAELPGVETMIGLFINTVPVRVRLQPQQSAADVVKALQDEQIILLPHHHLGLSDIQRIAGTGQLFDTIAVYENYPVSSVSATADNTAHQLQADVVGGADATHYPLALVAVPGTELRFRLDYQPTEFNADEADTLLHRFVQVIESVVREPETPISQIEV